MARISVIVPVYNTALYLEACLDSILNQTFTDFEIIIVDDGSTDSSWEICCRYAKRDARIHLIQQTNQGLSAARNRGLDAASGDYIGFCDSDDYMDIEMLASLYEAIRKDHSQMAVCGIVLVDENGVIVEDWQRAGRWYDGCVSKEMFWRSHYKKGCLCHVAAWNKLYARELFDSIRFPVGRIHEDTFVYPYLTSQCECISCIEKRLIYYRRRSGSITQLPYNRLRLDALDGCIQGILFARKKKYPMLKKAYIKLAYREWEEAYRRLDLSYGDNKKALWDITWQLIHATRIPWRRLDLLSVIIRRCRHHGH